MFNVKITFLCGSAPHILVLNSVSLKDPMSVEITLLWHRLMGKGKKEEGGQIDTWTLSRLCQR